MVEVTALSSWVERRNDIGSSLAREGFAVDAADDRVMLKKDRILGLPRTVFFLGLTSFFNDFSSEMVSSIFPAFFISVLKTGAEFSAWWKVLRMPYPTSSKSTPAVGPTG